MLLLCLFHYILIYYIYTLKWIYGSPLAFWYSSKPKGPRHMAISPHINSYWWLINTIILAWQVAPAELEAILFTHPSVEDAAVVPWVYVTEKLANIIANLLGAVGVKWEQVINQFVTLIYIKVDGIAGCQMKRQERSQLLVLWWAKVPKKVKKI